MKILMNVLRAAAPAGAPRAAWAATGVVVLATALGCSRSRTTESGAAASASAPAPSASVAAPRRPKTPGLVNAVPSPDEKIQDKVNPKKLPPYSGPTGRVEGLVTVKGGQAPELPDVVAKIGDKCKVARGVYGRLFREGLMRSAADVLVTVTGYDGYVPAKGEAVTVVGRDCAWDRLTIGMMLGQRLDVSSRGLEPYMPQLVGAPSKAMMVAVPRGSPVKLYALEPGRYALVDRVHAAMRADVFVLMYPTFDVTGLDGRYTIEGIPAGEVTVTAYLPAINKTAQKKVRIEPNQTHKVDLELEFDAAKDVAKPAAQAKGEAKPAIH